MARIINQGSANPRPTATPFVKGGEPNAAPTQAPFLKGVSRSDGGLQESDDLAVLCPDVTVELDLADGTKEKITVRELRFGEQLDHYATLVRLANALKPAATASDEDAITLILDALANERAAMTELVAVCSGKPVEWVTALTGSEGEKLLVAWWRANQGFFVRRLLRERLVAAARQAKADGKAAGEASSQPLSDTATDGAN